MSGEDETERGRPYHHGALRPALLEAAVGLIAERGPAAVSLRELARRTGVSHAAPAHHFGDKAGLLTAVAVAGFDLLADALREAHETTGSLLEVGVAYVRFAVTHPAHFEVMFRPDLLRRDDPSLAAAGERAAGLLAGAVGGETTAGPGEPLRAAIAAWSLVHGLATLHLHGNLPPELGDDAEAITRAVAPYLFRAPPAG